MNIANLSLANPIILAPMAGITDLPYRRIMKEFGAALVFSEMISANGVVRNGRKSFELTRSSADERPLAIQIFGDEPAIIAETARLLEERAELIDINCGCPVNKVVRSGAGSALLREPARIGRIVAAVRKAIRVPLTIKIRSGWDQATLNYLEVGRIAAAEGADAITLHPRTRSQGFGGKADWRQIALLQEAVDIPVIGSGDIFTACDAEQMLSETGCAAIMIGRGGYGNPWLISNILRRRLKQPEQVPNCAERQEVALRHLQYHEECFGAKKTVFAMRKHLCWYSRGMGGSSEFRQKVNQQQTLTELRQITRDFYLELAGRD
jgi:tRNA-dihydrouridine synthase B